MIVCPKGKIKEKALRNPQSKATQEYVRKRRSASRKTTPIEEKSPMSQAEKEELQKQLDKKISP